MASLISALGAGLTVVGTAALTPVPAASAAPARAKTLNSPALNSPALNSPALNSAALAAYLIGGLTGAASYQPYGPGFPDTGLTIDGILALSALGGHDATVTRMTDFVATQVEAFADPSNTRGAFAAGSVAKLALTAEVTGRDPHHFGGFDLTAALANSVCTITDPTIGCAAPGLYRGVTSTFAQALAIVAQARDGGAATPALAALAGLACSGGGFPSVLPARPHCTGRDSDADSTSMAAQALDLDPRNRSLVTSAVSWIAAQQKSDGGFDGTAGRNSNSTALAIQALGLHGGQASAITQARQFLAARQNADGGLGVNTTDATASDLRASTQGLSGSVGLSFGVLSRPLLRSAPAAARTADASAGVRFLSSGRVLVAGTHATTGGAVDYGLTADIALALAAADTGSSRLTRVVTYLARHVADYADPAGAGTFPGPYSGALAKLALLAEVTHQDPHRFAGFDLLGVLRAHRCTKADRAGTCTAPGDFFQAFSGVGQALGVLALARAEPLTTHDPAVIRLLQLQCPDGGFSSDLPPAAVCRSDVDTTGFAAQALSLVTDVGSGPTASGSTPAADALSRAQDFLLAVQRSDGTFPGAAGDNTNSTALAVQGLLALPAGTVAGTSAAGMSITGPAVGAALAALHAAQNGDGGFGVTVGAGISDARATAQAVLSLDVSPLATLAHPIPAIRVAATTPTTRPAPRPPAPRARRVPDPRVPDRQSAPRGLELAATGSAPGPGVGLGLGLVASGVALMGLSSRRRLGRG